MIGLFKKRQSERQINTNISNGDIIYVLDGSEISFHKLITNEISLVLFFKSIDKELSEEEKNEIVQNETFSTDVFNFDEIAGNKGYFIIKFNKKNYQVSYNSKRKRLLQKIIE